MIDKTKLILLLIVPALIPSELSSQQVYESDNDWPTLTEHFKSHIGESPAEIAMFRDPDIIYRLENLMGESSFDYMAYIYQTQGGIEYNNGMFWGSAFMAHQCCDPATVWAYDTYNDSFYVWIRKDGRDYWWSESGSIPVKFKEIVSLRF